MLPENQSNEEIVAWKGAKINQALGLYIFIFGIIVMFAHFYTHTMLEKITDLVAGFILVVIGGSMILFARRRLRGISSK
jgi:hypothetical protein